MPFSVVHRDGSSKARLGVVRTSHGAFDTPAFMPVGSRAAVKMIAPRVLDELGAQIVLSNTYHLMVRPGVDVVERLGGLHRFMAWDKPIVTDSGGFQVFSLAGLRAIADEGVTFQSHIDGTRLFLGPREAMAIQRQLGSDIAMAFDECPASTADRATIASAVKRTLAWARLCIEDAARHDSGQLVFGIVQGGVHDDLRRSCADELVSMPFHGYAVGGLAVGEASEEMYRVAALCCDRLPEDKPRYLMGVGTPEDILHAVMRGIDMFDCVLPTRNGRNGSAFTDTGDVPVKGGRFKDHDAPVQAGCDCYTCRTFSRAYIRHLFNVGEALGCQLLTIHNLHFYLGLMRDIRQAARDDRLDAFARGFIEKRKSGVDVGVSE